MECTCVALCVGEDHCSSQQPPQVDLRAWTLTRKHLHARKTVVERLLQRRRKLSELTSQRANFSQTRKLHPNRKWAQGQAVDRKRKPRAAFEDRVRETQRSCTEPRLLSTQMRGQRAGAAPGAGGTGPGQGEQTGQPATKTEMSAGFQAPTPRRSLGTSPGGTPRPHC